MEKVIKRGYVKWEDENGFHKEPLADHPDMLAQASPADQLRAEEARRLNAAAEETAEEQKASEEETAKEALEALKAAPEEVLTAADLDTAPASAAEEPATDHDEALRQLREKTSE